MEILKCEGIKKVYGSGANQVKALNGIDLVVDKGEFVAIIGASGSGKSTLLHILGSVDKPTEGKVVVGELIYLLWTRRRPRYSGAGRSGWFISFTI